MTRFISVRFLAAYLILMVCILILASCGKEASPVTISKDGMYINEFFSLRVQKPDGWYAPTAEEMIHLQQRGTNFIAGKDTDLKKAIESSLNSTLPIFSFFELPPGTPGKQIPNVVSAAENIQGLPGIKNGCDYLSHTKTLLKQSQLPYEFDNDECKSKVINGNDFGSFDAQIKLGSRKVYQRYFAIVTKGYALCFVQTYFDDDSEKKVNSIISSLSIK